MKKLLIVLSCALLLTGCKAASSYEVKVSDNTKTLLTVDGVEISKQGYFEALLDSYGADKIISECLEKIADKEVTDTKKVEELVKERKKVYEDYLKTSLDEFAKQMGYKNEAEFVDDALRPDAKQEVLRGQYISANFDALMSEYKVTRLKKIVVELESEAIAIINEAKDKAAFDSLMTKHKDKAQDLDIVTKNTSLDSNILKKLDELYKLDKDGVVPTAVKQADGKFAVLYVYDTKKEDKQEYVDALTVDTTLQGVIESYYLKKYNFNVYDQKLKETIKHFNTGYIE